MLRVSLGKAEGIGSVVRVIASRLHGQGSNIACCTARFEVKF